MIAPVFVDTNILVYARDASEAVKQQAAAEWMEELWRDQSGRLSSQILSEFYVTVTRKLSPGLTPDEAWDDIEALFSWRPLPVDVAVLKRGHDVERRFGLSWWDSLVVAAAQLQGCALLLTEDLRDGADYAGVVACNPFAHRVAEQKQAYLVPTATRRVRQRGRPRR
jgi:predicted nucleic acid-binding protein